MPRPWPLQKHLLSLDVSLVEPVIRKERRRKKPQLEPEGEGVIGFAWFFENIVIFGDAHSLISMLNQRKARYYGNFLGVVKGLIPHEKFRVLYIWLKHRESFLQRQRIKRLARKQKIPLWKFKRQLKTLRKL